MRKGNTKERLIMAALELFSVKGYEGTSVEEIARVVGIKAPTMYKYLKGKEELLQILFERSEEEYEKGMKTHLEKTREIRSGKELKKYSMDMVEFTLNNEMSVKMRKLFTIEQYRNEKFAERATRYHVTQMRTVFESVFRELMDKGIVVKGDPDLIAFEYTAPVTLMIQMSDRQPEKKGEALSMIEKHFDTFIERYCKGK